MLIVSESPLDSDKASALTLSFRHAEKDLFIGSGLLLVRIPCSFPSLARRSLFYDSDAGHHETQHASFDNAAHHIYLHS